MRSHVRRVGGEVHEERCTSVKCVCIREREREFVYSLVHETTKITVGR